MKPPAKRPKLGNGTHNEDDEADNQDELTMTPVQFNAQQDPSYHLEKGREKAANKLKSRFESIFDKYGKDFTDIGDEIDLETGEIIIDNGHIQSWEDDDDGKMGDDLLESEASDDEEDAIPIIPSSDEVLASAVVPAPISAENMLSAPSSSTWLGQASGMLGQMMPSLPQGAMSLGQSGNLIGGAGFLGPHMFGPNSPFNYGFMAFGLGRGPVDPNWQVPELPMSLQTSMSPHAPTPATSGSSIQYDSRGRPKNKPSLTDVVRQRWPKLKPKVLPPTTSTAIELDPLALGESKTGNPIQDTSGPNGTSASPNDNQPNSTPKRSVSDDVDTQTTDTPQPYVVVPNTGGNVNQNGDKENGSSGVSGQSETATFKQGALPQWRGRGREEGQPKGGKAQSLKQNKKTKSSEQKPTGASSRLGGPQTDSVNPGLETNSAMGPESKVVDVPINSELRRKRPGRPRKGTGLNEPKSQPEAEEETHKIHTQHTKPGDVVSGALDSEPQRLVEVILAEEAVDSTPQLTITSTSTNPAPAHMSEVFARHELDPSYVFSDEDDDFRKPRQTKKPSTLQVERRSQGQTKSVDAALDVGSHGNEAVVDSQTDVINEMEVTVPRAESEEIDTSDILHDQPEQASEVPNDDVDTLMDDVGNIVVQPEAETETRSLRQKIVPMSDRPVSRRNRTKPSDKFDDTNEMNTGSMTTAVTNDNDDLSVPKPGPETPSGRLSKISAQPPLTSSASRRNKKRKLADLSSLIPDESNSNEGEGMADEDLDELSIISSAGFDSTPKSFRIKLEERSFHGSSPASHHHDRNNRNNSKNVTTPRKTPSPFVPPHLRHIYQHHYNTPPTPSPRRNSRNNSNGSSNSLAASAARRTQQQQRHHPHHQPPPPPATDSKALRNNNSNYHPRPTSAAQSSPLARTAAWRHRQGDKTTTTTNPVVVSTPSSRNKKSLSTAATASSPTPTPSGRGAKGKGTQGGGEEKEEEGTLVQTPGGTKRRCGTEGFVCDRDFCLFCCT